MTTLTKYTYSILDDFLNHRVVNDTLTAEINASDIVTKLKSIEIIGNIVSIWFNNILSVDDNNILDTIISNHQGNTILQKVKIEEEDISTGKHFGIESKIITTAASTSKEIQLTWPIPITVLCFKLSSILDQKDDILDISIGPNTVGTIINNVIPPIAWSSRNYTQGQVITYNHPTFGIRPYTCIVNTVSNEIPLDANYW